MRNDTRKRSRLLWGATPLVLLSLGCIWPWCQVGGGQHEASVTVPGTDGVQVKAEAAGGETAARLVLDRATREVSKGHEVEYVIPKSLVTQELRLEINDGAPGATFVLAERDEASAYEKHVVDVAPDGKRVAYRLGDEPFRFVYLLSPELAVHGPRETDTLDWAKIPTLADDFAEVFDAHSLRRDGKYSFEKKDPLLKWLRAHADEDAVVDALFELIPRDDHQWVTFAESLTPRGQEALREKLRKTVRSGASHPLYNSRALDFEAVEPPKLPASAVRRATHALADAEATVRNDGVDLAEFLRVHASHDLRDAAKIGCRLLGIESEAAPNGLPYALDLGRPLQLVALAVVAQHGKTCEAVQRLPDLRCSACGGACSETTLKSAVDEALQTELQAPEIGETPQNPSLRDKLVAAVQTTAVNNPPRCP